jgi:hypothetical protein
VPPSKAGRRARAELAEAEGGWLRFHKAAALLDLTPQALDQWRSDRRLVAWQDEAGNWCIPVWQVDPRTAALYPGLDRLLVALPGDAWSD